MTSPSTPINLDKLRNAVQKFGSNSFTTAQVAGDYQQGEGNLGDAGMQRFEELLRRHAALLGISPQPSSAGGDTVWMAV
jgi:nitrogen regulatory protein PII